MISSTLKVKRSCCINQKCLWWDVVKNKIRSKQHQRQPLLTIFNYHTKKKKKNNTNYNNNDTKEHKTNKNNHNKRGDIFLHSGALLKLLVLLVVFCTSMQQLDCVEYAASATTATTRTTTVASVLRTTITTNINHSSFTTTTTTTVKNSMQHEAIGETIKRKYRRKLINNNPTNQENILRYSIYKGKRRKHLKHPINRKYSNAPITPSTAVVVITPPTTTRMPTTYISNMYMQQQQQQQQQQHQLYMSKEHSKNTMPKSIILQQQQQQQQHQTFMQHQQQQQQQHHDITHVSQGRKYLHVYESQQQQQQQEQKFMSPNRMNNATTVKGVHWQKQHGIIYQQLPRNLSSPKQHYHQQQQQQHRNKHTSPSVFNKSSSNRKDHVIAEAKTDIILYRNVVGPLPCPPGLSPHRVVPVYTQKHPTNQRHQECKCSTIGSISTVCEKRGGQCSCLANVL